MKLAEWLEHRAGLKGKKLEVALSVCESNMIETVGELRVVALDENEKQFKETFPQSMLRTAILMALKAGTDGDGDGEQVSGQIEVQAKEEASKRNDGAPAPAPTDDALPPGKRYAYFASHKKQHSRFGDSSADLARAQKDYMLLKYKLEGYFDADNLQKINRESITRGIVESCSVLLYLNDETLSSEWCRHEVDEARRYGIPIIVLVDTDKQTSREVIDKYMELGFSWLFDEQVITYSTQSRDHAYLLCSNAMRRAIQYCAVNDTLTPKSEAKKAPESDAGSAAGAGAKAGAATGLKALVHTTMMQAMMQKPAIDEAAGGALAALKKSLLSVYGSAQAAFEALSSSDGIVGRKQWKRAVKKASLSDHFTGIQLKELRSSLPKLASLSAFCSFMDGSAVADESGETAEASHLAPLPPEVPALPSSFRHREHAEAQLTSALVESGRRSTSLTAPKSRVSSQGMGGVGKTMLTAAVVRSDAIRSHFRVICWLNCSQEPQLMQLQQNLYEQLTDNESMPKSATKSAASQKRELIKSAKGKLVLLVLDDMWSREHAEPFDCVDATNDSKLLVTTRIKGILDKGHEVELELLSVRESVELLSAVAQLDTSEVSPCMIEIAQLCGRLPLCLNIVGNLVRTYGGSGWEEEIPQILKKDMKSLASGEGAEGGESLNLQQRVIQSGLDSLAGSEAESIVLLFKGMAVFAEDQVVPVGILSVLWVSLDPQEHKALSGMKVRQWVSQLLSRSILLGSASAGVSMHDIVRDFTLSSSSPSELQHGQAAFVQAVVGSVDGKSSNIAVQYSHESLAVHVRGAVSGALHTQKWCLECLLHKDMALVDQVLQGFAAAEVSALAEWLSSDAGGRDFMSAAVLYVRLAEMMRGSTKQEWAEYIRRCIAAADRATEGPDRAEAIQLAFSRRYHMIYYGDSEQEKDECLEWLLAFMSDESRVAELNEYPQVQGKALCGVTYAGQNNSKFAVAPSYEQLKRGAEFWIESSVLRMEMVEKNKMTGFSFLNHSSSCFLPYVTQTVCYLAADQLNEAAPFLIGGGGCKVLAWADEYSFVHHERMMARNAYDGFVTNGMFMVLRPRFGAVEATKGLLNKWESIAVQAAAVGTSFEWQSLFIWPGLAPERLGRILKLRSLSYHNVAEIMNAIPEGIWSWKREIPGGGKVTLWARDAILLNAQLVLIANSPGFVPASEAQAVLPSAGSTPLDEDVAMKIYTLYELGYMQACRVAAALGDYHSAAQYAKATLSCYTNPVHQCFASQRLGGLAAVRQSMGAEDEE